MLVTPWQKADGHGAGHAVTDQPVSRASAAEHRQRNMPPIATQPSKPRLRQSPHVGELSFRILLGCVAIGGMFSLPVFLQPIARIPAVGPGVSSAMTIGFLCHGAHQHDLGTLSDRLGPLPVVLTGSSCWRRASGWRALRHRGGVSVHLRADVGLLRPIFAPMMAVSPVVRHPPESCGVAVSAHGHGADDHGPRPPGWSGIMTGAPRIRSWRDRPSIMIPVSLLVRRAPALASGPSAPSGDSAQADMTLAQALRRRNSSSAADQFLLLRHAIRGPSFIPELRHQLRHSVDRRVTIYSVEASLGLAPHAFGLMVTASRQAVRCWPACAGVRRTRLLFVRELAGVYTVSGAVRLHLSGTMPLILARPREFPLRMMGTVIGGTAMAGSPRHGTGPLAGV